MADSYDFTLTFSELIGIVIGGVIVGVLLMVIAILAAASWTTYQAATLGAPGVAADFAAVTQAFSSILLVVVTGGYVFLTYRLVRIEREARHRERKRQKPIVEIEDRQVEQGFLILYLSNVGKEVATNLEVVSVCLFTNTENFAPGIATSKLVRRSDGVENRRSSRSIKPGEAMACYEAKPTVGLGHSGQIDTEDQTLKHDPETMQRTAFPMAITELATEDVGIVRIHFYIRIQDALANSEMEHIFGLEFEPEGDRISFAEAYEKGGIMTWDEPIALSDEDLAFDLSTAEMSEERTVI